MDYKSKKIVVKLLIIVPVLFCTSTVLAVDYYWETTNPPGNVQWDENPTISSGDTLYINDPTDFGNTPITNDGTLVFNNVINTFQRIDNNNIMRIHANTTSPNTPTIYNNGGVLDIYDLGNPPALLNVENALIISGVTNCTNINLLGVIQNNGELTLNQYVRSPGLTNSGDVNLNGDFEGEIVNNSSYILNITGNRQIINNNLTNQGELNLTISDGVTYDSLQAASIDLQNGTVNITSSYSGVSSEWDVLTADNPILTGSTTIHIPSSTALEIWDYEFVNDLILRLSFVNNNPSTPSFTPMPGVDTEIANVLAVMQANTTNSGQAELLAAVDAITSQNQYNYLLSHLQPDVNGSATNTALAMQNMGFDKVEVRVASASRKNKPRKVTARKSKKPKAKVSGIASGDLNSNTAMWMAGLGSISKQRAKGDGQGYRGRTLGGMLGFDMQTKSQSIYGIAFGVSNANIYNLENSTFTTRILGYNLMLYGANNFKHNLFTEWTLSGVINKNYGVRVLSVDAIDLSTNASYRGALGGARLNVGKNFALNDQFNLAQVNTIQYVLVHQPSYNETGSVAALHVSTKQNQSILTLGTGVRLGILNNNPWLNGNRELRAMATYDAISPDQATTANFIVGSDSFIMTSSPARWAGRFGADCSFLLARKLSLQFSYDYEIRSGYYNNFGEVKLHYAF